MADTGRRPSVPHAHSSTSLGFGHFGTATYDDRTRQWSFLRDAQRIDEREVGDGQDPAPFRLVTGPTPILSATDDLDLRQKPTSKTTANAVLKSLPDTASFISYQADPALDHHSEAERENAASSLLVFGHALVLGSDDSQSGIQTSPIAAFATSSLSHDLVLMHIGRKVVCVDGDNTERFYVPGIIPDSYTSRTSIQGPLLQICMSAVTSLQKDTWLAVRQAAATSIFQPLIHRAVVSTSQRSMLDHNLIVELPIARTGGLQHSDISFHPKDARRLAVIDVGGRWSVWKINGTRSRTARVLYQAQLISQGSCTSETQNLQQFDGWHRMIWASSNEYDFDRLLVVNRRAMFLQDLHGSVRSEVSVQVGTKQKGWVLDLTASSSANELYVLTSSHILCLSVEPGTSAAPLSRGVDFISVVSSWNHFRGQGDRTLKLDQLQALNDTWLFLSSTDTALITIYRHQKAESDEHVQHWSSDPILWHASSGGVDVKKVVAIYAVASESLSEAMQRDNSTFVKIFLQAATGAVYEGLYQFCLLEKTSDRLINSISLPTKHILQHKSAYRVKILSTEDDMNGFIVPDDVMSYDDHELVPKTAEAIDLELPTGASQTILNEKFVRTCDLQRTYKSIVAQSFRPRAEEKDEFDRILETVDTESATYLKAKTLLEVIEPPHAASLHTSDIENDSSTLQTWLQQFELPPEYTNQSYTSTLVGPTDSLIAMYDDLTESWLSSLPETFPDRLRVQRERLLRRIALELFSSSIVVGQHLKEHAENDSQALENGALQSRMPQLAIETRPISPLSQEVDSSQVMARSKKSPRTSLSSYVDYKQPPTPTPKSSALIQNILAHLPTSSGVDPTTYNYNEVETNLALAQHEVDTSEMDPKARRRAEKLARARHKQLERQSLLKRAAFEQSTRLPSIMSSSQLPIRAVQSSQAGPVVVSSSQPSSRGVPVVSMTQPERGAFGKRDVKKAKGKGKASRQKGF